MPSPPEPSPDVPEQRRPAEDPTARYELFVDVARNLDQVPTAYDAELLVSTMLGAPYAIADTDRAVAISSTADGLRRHLARRRNRTALLLRTVLGVMVQDRQATMTDPPSWVPHVGQVKLTGTYTFGDQFRDQVTYLATFAYADEENGGPEHALAALVDHRTGHVSDLFMCAPAGALLSQLEAAASTDEAMRMAAVDPGELRAEVERHLAVTDELPELPDAKSLTSDRALAAHRLRLLPTVAPSGPDPVDFRESPEAARLAGADDEALTFCLKLIQGYAQRDPLRWSPALVEDFLLEWVPARALLDRADRKLLPAVLSAWVRWSGRVSGLTPKAVAQLVTAVVAHRDEFARRAESGSHRSEAAQAMAQLLADGIDLNDEAAVAAWIEEYNARET